VAAEEALLQQPKASPAASFDAFLQIDHKSKTSSAEAKQLDFEKLQKAMEKIVNAAWVDPETKKKLGDVSKTGLLQESESQDPMAAQVAQNDQNLAMFEGLKGKAEESLQKMRDEEVKKKGEHDVQMMSLKQAIALAENNVDDAKKERSPLPRRKPKQRRRKRM
jgi:hypothetical protein